MACPLPLCAKANQRRPRSARVDDAEFVTVTAGQWAQHSSRVECAGCDGFVRWNPRVRAPEEGPVRSFMGRRYIQPVDWLAKHDDYPPADLRKLDAARRLVSAAPPAARGLVGAVG
jgi:hypothetical protein